MTGVLSTGSELLTSNTAIAWPFDDDQGVPEEVFSLVADMSVSLGPGAAVDGVYVVGATVDPAPGGGKVLNMAVGMGAGQTPEWRVICRSADWDGSGSPFIRADAVAEAGHVYGVHSVSVVFDAELLGKSPGFSFVGVGWRLSDSCVVPASRLVETLSLWNSIGGEAPEPTYAGIRGDVSFLEGYNMQIRAYDGRDGKGRLSIAAVPGSGLGRIPCECPDDAVEGVSLGNVEPDDRGDVLLIAEGGCMTMNGDGGASLRIGARCTPCCTVDQYVDAVRRVKEKNDSLTSVKDDLFRIRDQYAALCEAVTGMAGGITPRTAVKVSLALEPPKRRKHLYSGWKNRGSTSVSQVSGAMDRCVARVFVANQSNDTVYATFGKSYFSDLRCAVPDGTDPLYVSSEPSSIRCMTVSDDMTVGSWDGGTWTGSSGIPSASMFLGSALRLKVEPGQGVVVECSLVRWGHGLSDLSWAKAKSFHARVEVPLSWKGGSARVSRSASTAWPST